MRFVCLIVIKEVDFMLVVYKDNIGYGYLGYKSFELCVFSSNILIVWLGWYLRWWFDLEGNFVVM